MIERTDILITKFLSGNASEEEQLRLENWRKKNEENENYFQDFAQAWKASDLRLPESEPDTGAAWLDLQNRLKASEGPRKLFTPLRIAAGIALLVFLSIILTMVLSDTQPDKPSVVAIQKVATTTDTEQLLVATPDTFVVNEQTENERAKNRIKRSRSPRVTVAEMFTIATGDSAKAFLLPDNSIVFLNEHSTLNYADDFNINSRKVSLTGEAYFEISKDTMQFVVACRNTITRGTDASFNIRGYERDEQVEVIIVSGSAEFSGVGRQFKKLVLTKGESGVSTPDGDVVKTKIQRRDYKWWQKKNLRFTLKRIVEKIRNVFR